jgi:hypothetical protein
MPPKLARETPKRIPGSCGPTEAGQQNKQARHMDRTSSTSRSILARVLLMSAFA